MWRWSVFCCRQRGLTSQVLKVVFAGRGCCCGSIEGGGMNHGLLSTPIRIAHFPTNPDFRCINRWCERHSRTRLFITVGPPLAQCRIWCASVHAGTHVQPGNAQPLSRAINATRCSGVTNRFPGFASSGAP